MSIKKKLCLFLAFVCTAVLAAGALTLTAKAETYSGTCGDNLTWTLDTGTGTLTISGEGEMKYANNRSYPPWSNYKDKIKNVELPDKLTSISGSAFSYCRNLTSVTIPDGVTSIGMSAFDCCDSLMSVTIPDSVTSIGNSAFNYCSSLTSITMPEGVLRVGSWAFSYCSSLTSIIIPSSVTDIGEYAFFNCDSITSITVPANVTNIGEAAFSYCTSMEYIDVDINNTKYMSLEGILFSKDKKILMTYPPQKGSSYYEIPSGVTNIDSSAFSGCNNLTSITIPNGVTNIGINAFSGCGSLTSITIPDGVTSLGESVFQNCSSLISITLPEGITNIGNNIFRNCSSLTSITLPNSVKSMGDYAFYNCINLTSITLSDGLTSLEEFVFYNCSSLISITLPDSATSIGGYAFKGCSSLTSITMPDGLTSIGSDAFSGCSSLISIIIPDSVTSIGYRTFEKCSNLTSITMPDSATWIGGSTFRGCSSLISITISDEATIIIDNYAFEGCSSLTLVTLPNSVRLPNSVTGMGNYAFYNCSSLKSITIPDGVTTIGNHVFDGCSSLTSIVMPNSVTNIGDYAFSGCSSLTSITLSDGLTSIENSTFKGCSSLTTITIPDSVTSIGNNTFSGCSNLTSIIIPDSVTSIGWYAFEKCSSLKSITIPDGVTTIGSHMFDGCSSLTSIVMPNSVANIGDYAFRGCSSLKSITIPGRVTSIGDNAFNKCKNLTSITLSDGLTSIGRSAFSGCSSLKSITIPDGVTSIGTYAFSSCKNLTSIILSDGLTSIETGTFDGCSSLTSVTIPKGVTSIGIYAFFRCENLTSITIPDGLTSIGEDAFKSCDSLFVIYNNSDIKLTFGSTDNGYIALNAKAIVNKDGTITYVKKDNTEYFLDNDRFLFEIYKGKYFLIAYAGESTRVVLPRSANGNSYKVCDMRGAVEVVLSDCDETNEVLGSNGITNWLFNSKCIKKIYIYNIEAVIYDDANTFPENVIIHGFKGSTAQAYAEKYNRTFVDMAEGCEHETQGRLIISDDKQTAYTKYKCSKCGYNYKENYTGTIINDDGIYRFIDGKRSVIEDELIEIDGKICRVVNDQIAEIHIDSVSITGPALPVRGEYPDMTATIADTTYSRIKSVVWSTTGKFKADMQYTVAITVEPVGKGKYTEQTAVFFNGASTSATLNDDGTLTVKRTYYPTINYSICVIDAETRLPIPGAIVTLGGNTVVCDENGIASYILHTGETTTLRIEAADYPVYELDKYCISMLPCDYIVLELESTGIYEVTSKGKNIFEQKLQINCKANTLYVDITVKGRANSQIQILRYEILQNDKLIDISTDGKFKIKNTKFTADKDVYVRMYTNGADGHNVFERKINIKVISFSFKGDLKALLGDVFEAKISFPDDTPFIGGLKLKIPYGNKNSFDVGVSVQNDKIIAVIGTELNLHSIEKETENMTALQAWDFLNGRMYERAYSFDEAKSSMKTKLDISGAVVIGMSDFNKVTKIYGQLNVKLSFEASIGTTVSVIGVPIRLELKMDASGEIEVRFLSYDYEEAEFVMPPTLVKLGLTLDAFAGIGTKIVSVGFYGTASGKLVFQIIPDVYVKQVELAGSFGVRFKMKLFWYTYKHNFSIWSGKYKWNNVRAMLLKAIYNSDSYSEDMRDYLKDRSEWMGDADETVRESESTVLQRSSYTDIKPQIVVCGNTTMMLFLDDDGSDGLNYQHLFYSLYDTAAGKWSTPVRVDSGNLADIEFEAFSNGDKIYVTYIKSGEVTDENKANHSEVISTFEVMVAEYDASKGKFVNHTNISENDSYDMNPQITATDDGIVVVWINNTTGDVFAQNANNVIYMRKYVSGKWEAVKTVTGYGALIMSMDIGRLDGKLYIAAVRDIDCDYSTETDRIVVLIDENGNVTEMKTINNKNDAVKFVNLNGKEMLMWYNGFNLYKVESAQDTPVFIFENGLSGLTPDYKLIQIDTDTYALLYTIQEKYTDDDGNDCCGSDIYAVLFKDGVWSNPVTLTRTADDRYVDGFDVLVYDGNLIIPYISTFADFSNENLYIVSDFMSVQVKLDYDIELSDCKTDSDTLFDGDDLGIWCEIRNNSLIRTEYINIRILDSKGNTVYEQNVPCFIKEGETVIEYISIPKELLLCGDVYTLYVGPVAASDADPANNSIQLELWYSKARVYADTVVVGDKTMLQYALYNRGNISSNGILKIYKLDDETETVLYTYEVESLPVGECFSGFAEISDELYPESGNELIIGVRFESETKELYGTGDETFVYLEKISRNPLIEVKDPNTIVPPTIDMSEIIYDKKAGGDVVVKITENGCTFSMITGVEESEYYYENGLLTITADYLATLEPNDYYYDIVYRNAGTDVTVTLFIRVTDTTPKEPAVSVDIAGDIYYDGYPIESGVDFTLETESDADISTYWSVDGQEWNSGLPADAGHYYIRIEIAEDLINGYSYKEYVFELEILKNTRAISIPQEVFVSGIRTVGFGLALPTKGALDGTILYGYSKINDVSTVEEWLEEGVLPIADTSEIYYIFAKICGGSNYEDAYSIGFAADAHVHEFDDEYSYDMNRHWHSCRYCKARTDEADHTYDNNESKICNVCKAVKYVSGDLDENDTVDMDDAEYLLMHIYFPSEYPLNQDCDFNSDGKINSDDAIYLLKHTQRPDDYPLGSGNKASENAIPVKRKIYGEDEEAADDDEES